MFLTYTFTTIFLTLSGYRSCTYGHVLLEPKINMVADIMVMKE